jgi:predicted ester cyclase
MYTRRAFIAHAAMIYNFLRTTMRTSTNDNILAVIRQVVEKGFGEADMDVIDRMVHTDVIEHQFGRPNGREALKRSIQSIANGFSDIKYTLQRYSIDGDIVWVHYVFTAVHTGAFAGYEPTGKNVDIHIMDIAKIRDGQIVEHWGVPDQLALLKQIGALGQKR